MRHFKSKGTVTKGGCGGVNLRDARVQDAGMRLVVSRGQCTPGFKNQPRFQQDTVLAASASAFGVSEVPVSLRVEDGTDLVRPRVVERRALD